MSQQSTVFSQSGNPKIFVGIRKQKKRKRFNKSSRVKNDTLTEALQRLPASGSIRFGVT